MLRDTHRPERADTCRCCDHPGELLQFALRDRRYPCGELQREGREAGAVFVEPGDARIEEFLGGEAVVEDVFGDRREPDHVCAGVRTQEEVGALRHLVLAQIDDDEFLAVQFVRPLDARGDYRVRLRRVGADNQHEVRHADVRDGAAVAAVADGAEEAGGGGSLAVARAVVHIVRADDGAGKFLNEVCLLVRTFRGGDQADAVRPVGCFDRREPPRDEAERFRPRRRAELIALADQGRRQPLRAVDEVPAELALDAGGDAVRRCGDIRLYLENVAPLRPHLERAADAAVGADGLGAADFRRAHRRLGVGDRHDRDVAGVRLDRLDDLDHRPFDRVRQPGEESGLAEHRGLDQRVARADGDAVAAGDATRLVDRRAAVPQHARLLQTPVNRQRLIDLQVLARLDAAAAEDALVGVVAIEGVGVVHRIGFAREGILLVRNLHHRCRVVDGAVAVVVLADGAIEFVILEDALHPLLAGEARPGGVRMNRHTLPHRLRARPHSRPSTSTQQVSHVWIAPRLG